MTARSTAKRLGSVTRRQFMAGAFGAALLVACGGDDEEEGSGGATGSAFPVEVAHKYGNTTVPSVPAKVVSIGFTDHEALLGLGVTPIAVRDWWGGHPYATWPWAKDELGDATPVVLASGELDIEQVAALEPDLIVGFYSGLTEDEYNLLNQIAPTVIAPTEYIDYGMPWREQTQATGRVLGKEELATSKIAEVDAMIAKAKEDNPSFVGATAVIGGPNADGTYWLYGKDDPRSRLLRELGFVIAPELASLAGDSFYANVSAEQAQLFDVDLLVWWLESEEEMAQLAEDAVYQQINVVKEGRAVVSSWDDLAIGALSFSSILSLPYALEEYVPRLAEARANAR